MLMPDIALAVLVFMPLLLTFFLKSNAALGFLMLCLGFVLSTSVIGDLKHLLSESNLSVSNEALAIALILVPFLITLVLSHKSAGKEVAFFAQLIVSVFAGGLLALTIGPLLGNAGEFNIMNSSMWDVLVKSQAVVIGIGSLLAILLIWSSSFKHSKKH